MLLGGAACMFVAFLCWLAADGVLPPAVPVVYVVMSLAAFVAYGLDKSAAHAGAWRTPESTLHVLAVAGGWPGALLAQRVLHHKSRKPTFQAVFWATVVINCAALALLWKLG